MCLIAWIRALITTIVLASYSPLGLAIDHREPDSGHVGHLAISLFIGRRTRVAASQQFDVSKTYAETTAGFSRWCWRRGSGRHRPLLPKATRGSYTRCTRPLKTPPCALIWLNATSGREEFTFGGFSRIRELTARSASESRVSFEAEAGFRPAILAVIAAKSSSRFATLT